MKIKKRLDVLLVERLYAETRSKAQAIIMSGNVYVNGQKADKPGTSFEETVEIEVRGAVCPYVSRGGLKLEKALRDFGVKPDGFVCSDSGASTGGFTDCLLRNGAKSVISLDSGSGQLVKELRCDPRVFVMENYNARYIDPIDLPYVPELAVMDVSFISATYIIPSLCQCLAPGADFICLIKPQFEAGKGKVGKGGIVKDEKVRRAAIEKVCDCASAVGFECLGVVKSGITGGDGNVEYLAHFKKK